MLNGPPRSNQFMHAGLDATITSENETTFSLHHSTSVPSPIFPCGSITCPDSLLCVSCSCYCAKRVLIEYSRNVFRKIWGQLEHLMFEISVGLDMISQCWAPHTPILTSSDLLLNYLTLQEGYEDGSVSWF